MKKIKSMTWDEISTILQVIGGIVLALSFVVGIAVIWAGIKANQEKDKQVREQSERIAELTKEAEAARERTATLEIKVSQAEEKRLEAEKDLLELQDRFSPRTIPPEDRKKLSDFLHQSPTSRVEIMYSANDAEAFRFASQIVEILKDIGWEVSLFTGAVSLGSLPNTGLSITVRDQQNQAGAALQRGLSSIGFEAGGQLAPNQDANLVFLNIGAKPIQHIGV